MYPELTQYKGWLKYTKYLRLFLKSRHTIFQVFWFKNDWVYFPVLTMKFAVQIVYDPKWLIEISQKYAVGSDWLAGPVCCDLVNRLVDVQKCPAPHLSALCSANIVNNGVVNIAYQFEPEWDQRILVKRIAQNRCKHSSHRTFQNGMFFVWCCLILLVTLLFVNATASTLL